MNALVTLLRLKHQYSLVPNELAIQTRRYGTFALPVDEESVHPPESIEAAGDKEAGGETHGLRRPDSDNNCRCFPAGMRSVANRNFYDGCSDHDDYGDEGDCDAGIDSSAPIQESCVFCGPHSRHLSHEALRRKYQCEDGASFFPLVRDLRALCMRRRTEQAVAWRCVGAVRVTRNGGGDHDGGERGSRELQHVSITMGHTSYRTYARLWERVVALGCGLRALGLSPGAMVGICGGTRWEWLATCYAVWSQRFVCVLFDGDKVTAEQVAAEIKLSVVVCTRSLLPQLHAIFAARRATHMPAFVVVNAGGPPDMEEAMSSCAAAQWSKTMEVHDAVVHTWAEVLKIGRAEWERCLAVREACRKLQERHKAESDRLHANGGEDAVAPFAPSSPPLGRDHSHSASSTAHFSSAPLERQRASCGGVSIFPRRTDSGGASCNRSLSSTAGGDVTGGPDPCTGDDDDDGEDDEDVEAEMRSCAVLNFPTGPTELAVVIYNAGDSKGVMLSHGALKAAVTAYQERLNITKFDADFSAVAAHLSQEEGGSTRSDEEQQRPCYLGYLPFALIMEFVAENVFLHRGYLICYGTPFTLYQRQGTVSVLPHGDLCEFKPLVLVSVPYVLNELRQCLDRTLPSKGFLCTIFRVAFEERRRAIRCCLDTPFLNNTVFCTPRKVLGGRCRAVISAAAPLSADTQEFLEVVCGVSVLQQYGLTESGGCGTLQYLWDTQRDCVGGLLDAVELKLRDVGPWRHSNACPSGEVLLRGPTLMSGYYARPAETSRALDGDGWLHTGDVVELQCNGSLRVVASVKNVVKNGRSCIDLDALERI
ncbi:putative long-chain-fatty-acid-CoA ligase [Trypanosoma rangeli]|uniref:Putative long-chain-fatty-acid-CoA ligase n=1 Tax=Trypanosoma rangeli TaxID=5698 RepID=A0A3R7KA62_TRYRA|nr:putative long-chain-fatty-acid-CoA ligase [Trypanosoma rangeli]RNF04189.1 putative long-chain-fatty-acid-CoA ligase [Trypanosoma rangeli]|eukprot:RNF04189.1 putative long-chain-fatty-acid-CoA ligase [Trypanosoma rangeli]